MKNATIILCGFLCLLHSEDFKKLPIKNISSNRVLSATQDSSGFVWIGTDEGLNRYDGHSNKVYRSNIFDDKTISGNRIWITHIDKGKTLWVGTDRGVCYYNEEEDIFQICKDLLTERVSVQVRARSGPNAGGGCLSSSREATSSQYSMR